MTRAKPLHARGSEYLAVARTVSPTVSRKQPIRFSTRLSTRQSAAAVQAPGPSAPPSVATNGCASTRSGSLSTTSDNARQADMANDESYEEGYQDALLEIGCAIRYLRRLHKSRVRQESTSTPEPVESVDDWWRDVSTSQPRSPTPRLEPPSSPPPPPPPPPKPEETATVVEIRPSGPGRRRPATRHGINKSKAKSTSDEGKGKPRNRSESKSNSLNINTGMDGSVRKNKNKNKSNKRKSNGVDQITRGTSKSKTTKTSTTQWEAAMKETGHCRSVTTGMYINGEVAVGGKKAMTLLRKPPCPRCVKFKRVCLVLDLKRETMTGTIMCGHCARLGVSCK